MIPTPARITGIMTAGDMAGLRSQADRDRHADVIKDVAHRLAHHGDAATEVGALYYMLGELDRYVRGGGDVAVSRIVQDAMTFATSRERAATA